MCKKLQENYGELQNILSNGLTTELHLIIQFIIYGERETLGRFWLMFTLFKGIIHRFPRNSNDKHLGKRHRIPKQITQNLRLIPILQYYYAKSNHMTINIPFLLK